MNVASDCENGNDEEPTERMNSQSMQAFACYHLADRRKLSISCIGHFDFPRSVYNLWSF